MAKALCFYSWLPRLWWCNSALPPNVDVFEQVDETGLLCWPSAFFKNVFWSLFRVWLLHDGSSLSDRDTWLFSESNSAASNEGTTTMATCPQLWPWWDTCSACLLPHLWLASWWVASEAWRLVFVNHILFQRISHSIQFYPLSLHHPSDYPNDFSPSPNWSNSPRTGDSVWPHLSLRHGHHSLARKRALGLHGGVARPMVTWGSPIVWTPSCGNSWMCFFIPKVRHIDDLVGRLGWFFFFSLQIYSPQRRDILMRLRKYSDYS